MQSAKIREISVGKYISEILRQSLSCDNICDASLRDSIYAKINPMELLKIPKRKKDTNKGDYGKVLVIAGSKTMSGAAYLTALSALRSGAGLVYLAVPKGIHKIVAPKVREVIVIPLPETKKGSIALEAYGQIVKIKADVIAIGPGLTTEHETKELVKKLIKNLKVKQIILDADGLNAIADNQNILKSAKSKIIITPHPGEMARLTGLPIDTIQSNRKKIALQYSKKWNVKIVLKGHETLVAYPDGRLYVNKTGNPGMAKAGVGDVLAGLIASFKAQGLCVCNAVYIHGLAGDLAAKKIGEYGLIASDIIKQIPVAIKRELNANEASNH